MAAASAAQCSLDAVGANFPQRVRLQGGAPAEHVQDKGSTWRFCVSQCRRKEVLGRHVSTAAKMGSSTWRSPPRERRGIERPGMLQVGSETEDTLTGRQRLGRSGGYRAITQPKTQHRRRPLGVRAGGTGSSFGTLFRVTTFGESHGGGVGCVIDGCPPQIPLSEADMQVELDRRRPGQSRITTPRKESDTCKILSGVAEGVTLGTPICVLVPNTDQRGGDYSDMELKYRPSHADATYDFKYGVRAVQGGGRSSARETIGRVAAGAVAKKFLQMYSGTEILAFVSSVHDIDLQEDAVNLNTVTMDQIESNIVRCPDPEVAEKMIEAIDAVRVRGDSCGGVVTCIARNPPKGLGTPVFDKLEAELGKAMMSLPATKGFEIGSGFEAVPMVEAMAALVLVDQLMQQYAQCHILTDAVNLQQQHTVSPPERRMTIADEAALYSEG
ncbi:hypothetical protein CBR_g41627 [Chara braunii]|uniref:Chorismate synthase n=1 Tax=Chara braunii TaxID=69332 RepID=A0A388LWC7_CHABU|nr:hypothetical protein CBR_g41627 [Chara braunii]|eukprot:GBG86565.1 hypothetical protein CBR_g41627 [Chara braunii]